MTGGKVKEGKSRTFTIRRTENLGQQQTVTYSTKSASAKTRKDFKPVSGALTFVPGEATRTVTVKTRGDGTDERREKFLLLVTTGEGSSEATARIKDDD